MIKLHLFLRIPAAGAPAAGTPAGPFRYHGDAAAREIGRLCPAAVSYLQCRTLAQQVDDQGRPPYDGVAQLRFAEPTDALEVLARLEVLAPLWRDATVTGSLVGQEHVIMRLPAFHDGGLIKGVFPFRRRSDLSVAAFQRYWLGTHGPIAARTERAACYVQTHPLPGCYRDGTPAYDGVTEIYWPDVAAARAAMASRQMREDQAGDAANFADPQSVILFLAEEETVLGP